MTGGAGTLDACSRLFQDGDDMTPISRKQPLYDQLVDLLHEKIENEMGPGDMLPSERELCETYGLSRTTVRLALAELERQGSPGSMGAAPLFLTPCVRLQTSWEPTASPSR